MSKIIEYSIQTDNHEEHFEDKDEARDFWNALSEKEKSSGQFFSKEWINEDEEGDVEILGGRGYAKGGLTPAKAQKMLDDGEANGKPLTDKQKRYFKQVCSQCGKKDCKCYAKGGGIYNHYTDKELKDLLADTKIEYQRASRNNWYDKILQRQTRFIKIKEELNERGVKLSEFERKLFNEENQDKYAKGGKIGEGYVIVERYWEDDDLKKVYFKEGEKSGDLDEATLFYTRREAEKFIKEDAWLSHLGEYIYVEQVKVIEDESDRGHTLELTNYAKGGEINLPNGVFIDTRKTTQSKDEILEMYSNKGYTAIGGGSLLSDKFKRYNRDKDVYIVVGEIKYTPNADLYRIMPIYMDKNEVAVQNYIPKNMDAKVITKIPNTDSSNYAKGGGLNLAKRYAPNLTGGAAQIIEERTGIPAKGKGLDSDRGYGFKKGGKIWKQNWGHEDYYTADIGGIHIDLSPSATKGEWYITMSDKGDTFASEVVKGLDNAKDQAELMIKEMGIKFDKGGKVKSYKLGDMWSSDFDYEGMLKYPIDKNISTKTPIKSLKKLASSYEDVNYHTPSKPLWEAIDWLEQAKVSDNASHTNNAEKAINKFKKNVIEMHEEYYSEDSGGGNDFLKIAADQRKKNIPKPLKNLELNPLNVPFGKVCEMYIGKDDLRPVMSLVNWDKPEKTIVCTDAHKLLHLTPSPFPKYSGLYNTPQKVIKELKSWEKANQHEQSARDFMANLEKVKEKLEEQQEVGSQYPNYKPVINYQNATQVNNIDTAKLFWYASVLNKAKMISPYGGAKVSYINNTTKQIVLRYKSTNLAAEQSIIYVGVNAVFLDQCLKGMMMLGEKNSCTFYNQAINRSMIFDYAEQGKFNLDKFNGFLLMPVFLANQSNPTEIGNDDFDISLDLAYDLDENAIYSNGKLYEINEELGYKAPKKLSSDTKKVVVKDKKSEKNDKLALWIEAFEKLIKMKPKDKKLKYKLEAFKKLQAYKT